MLRNRVESEVAHLQAMLGHEDIKSLVPTFICGGDVQINGITDSTAHHRGSGLLGRPRNQRVHRRIITPRWNTIRFRTKEFINAIISVVTGKCFNCHDYNALIILV